MASSETFGSVFGKISMGHLECSICFSCYREPKVLECFHSFCRKCLEELRQRQDPHSSKLTCPVCRRETTLKENRVDALPNNFTLSALVEEVMMQDQLLEGQGSEIKCQACDEDNRAVSRCTDCAYFLCRECQRAHERLAMMRSHKICTLAQLRSSESVFQRKPNSEVTKCGRHSDRIACSYCSMCKQPVCTACCGLDHETHKHSLVGLPEALDKCKEEIAELVAKAEKSKTELSIAVNDAERSCQNLEAMSANTDKKISRKAEEESVRIREEEQKLKQELEKICEERRETIDMARATNSREVTQAERKLHEVNQLMAHAEGCELLDLKQKLFNDLREVAGKQPERVPDGLSFVDFEEGNDTCKSPLGRLVLKDESNCEANTDSPRPGGLSVMEKWVLKAESKYGPEQKDFGFAYDVAAFSNNKIVVADIEHLQIMSLSMGCLEERPVVSQGQQIIALQYPSHMSVSKDDQLFVLDGSAVKVFDEKYQLLHQFTPGGPESTPTCLAADGANVIAVGYEGEEEISLHEPDGSLIKMLPAPMIGDYLTIYRESLIYVNYGKKKLVSVDLSGNLVFSTDINSQMHSKNLGPTSVCCDGDGNIYVAVLRPWSSEIHCYSPDGKYAGCVVEECGPTLGITFTPHGDLVAAAEDSVQIYCPL